MLPSSDCRFPAREGGGAPERQWQSSRGFDRSRTRSAKLPNRSAGLPSRECGAPDVRFRGSVL
eukprot:1480184-Alexandrium_andersonii.AAC.1